MVRDSDQKGYFYSSYTRLQRMAGLSRTAWFKARKGLIDKGIVRQVKGNDHVLTGVDNGWKIDETAWKRPENRDANTDVVTPVDSPGTETGTGNLDRTQVEPSACASGAVALVQPREPNGENQPSDRPTPPTANAGGGGSQVKVGRSASEGRGQGSGCPGRMGSHPTMCRLRARALDGSYRIMDGGTRTAPAVPETGWVD